MGVWEYLKGFFYGKPVDEESVNRDELAQESAKTDVLLDRIDITGVESCFRTGLIDRGKAEKISALAKRMPSLVERVKDYLSHPESTEFPLYAKGPEGEDFWIYLAHELGLEKLAGPYRIRRDVVVGTARCFFVENHFFDDAASKEQARLFADFARNYSETAEVIKGLCKNKMNLPGYDVCGLKPVLYIAEALGDEELVQHVKSSMQ